MRSCTIYYIKRDMGFMWLSCYSLPSLSLKSDFLSLSSSSNNFKNGMKEVPCMHWQVSYRPEYAMPFFVYKFISSTIYVQLILLVCMFTWNVFVFYWFVEAEKFWKLWTLNIYIYISWYFSFFGQMGCSEPA